MRIKTPATGVPGGAVGPVGVAVGCIVLVEVGVTVDVMVAVGVLVGVLVGVAVGVMVEVAVRVSVAVGWRVGARVEVGVRVGGRRPKRVPSCWAEYNKKPRAARRGTTSKKSTSFRILSKSQPQSSGSPPFAMGQSAKLT